MSEPRRREFIQRLTAAAATLPVVAPTLAAPILGRRIRVGQVGVGHAHASKISVYRESDDYEVVGIVEPNDELRRVAQSQPAYRDLRWMTSEQLMNVDGLDVVLVETEVRDLLDTAELCVRAGKHIHLDKPAGESLPQFQRIMKTAQDRQLMVQMGYMYRFNPGVVLLRQFLQEGWLGDIFEVHTVMSKVVAPATRRELAKYPGGILFELGCHILDLTIQILGAPNSVDGYRQHASTHDDQLYDNMLAVLQYDRAIATVKSAAMEVEGFSRRHLTVCGAGGTFHIQPLDNPRVQLALARDVGGYRRGRQEIELPKYRRYVDDAADMVQVLRGRKPHAFSYEHDLTVQATLLEACHLPRT